MEFLRAIFVGNELTNLCDPVMGDPIQGQVCTVGEVVPQGIRANTTYLYDYTVPA